MLVLGFMPVVGERERTSFRLRAQVFGNIKAVSPCLGAREREREGKTGEVQSERREGEKWTQI